MRFLRHYTASVIAAPALSAATRGYHTRRTDSRATDAARLRCGAHSLRVARGAGGSQPLSPIYV